MFHFKLFFLALIQEQELCNTAVSCENAVNEKNRLETEMEAMCRKNDEECAMAAETQSKLEASLRDVTKERDSYMDGIKSMEDLLKLKQRKFREGFVAISHYFGKQKKDLSSQLELLKQGVEDVRKTFVGDKRALESAVIALAEDYERVQEENAKVGFSFIKFICLLMFVGIFTLSGLMGTFLI